MRYANAFKIIVKLLLEESIYVGYNNKVVYIYLDDWPYCMYRYDYFTVSAAKFVSYYRFDKYINFLNNCEIYNYKVLSPINRIFCVNKDLFLDFKNYVNENYNIKNS